MRRREVPHLLRELNAEEQTDLEQLSRSSAAPAAWVERDRGLRWVRKGASYAEAGRRIGRTNRAGVSALVKRFNNEGLEAIYPRYGGGYHKYSEADYTRILDEAARLPSVETEGTAQWSKMRPDPIKQCPMPDIVGNPNSNLPVNLTSTYEMVLPNY